MDFFNEYRWHSSIEINDNIKNKKIISRLANNKANRNKFIKVASNSDFLIHKSEKVLWKISEDGKSIIPVFDDDILTEDNI